MYQIKVKVRYSYALNIFFQKLDVITNDLLKRALRFTGRLGVIASEEEDAPVSRNIARCLKNNKCY